MQYYDVTNTSLVKVPSSIVEAYIPLWIADGTVAATSTSSFGGGTWFIKDGQTSMAGNSSPPSLFTLNASWPTSTKFAFEATLYSATNGTAVSVELWDITSNAVVSASSVSTTSSTATVIRSGQFTLTPGHSYGVTPYNASSVSISTVDASLIVFG